jgi:hypothetical protein
MKRNQFTCTMAFTIIIAFLCGALSTQPFLGTTAIAQERQKLTVRGQRIEPTSNLRLKDNNGRIEIGTTSLSFWDRDGKRRVLIGFNQSGHPFAQFIGNEKDMSANPIIRIFAGNKLIAEVPGEVSQLRQTFPPIQKIKREVKKDTMVLTRDDLVPIWNKLDEITETINQMTSK